MGLSRAARPSNERRGPARGTRPKIAIVVASLEILGGHAVQARTLAMRLEEEGYEISLVPINPSFPRGLGWVRGWPYARTLLTQALYRASLPRLRDCDVVHVFAASHWSFMLGPVPAIAAARRYGKRVVLNYHSGEAEAHLARWGRLVHPVLRMADAIVVPSTYLRRIFSRRGHLARVIPNVVDTEAFGYRDRMPLRPRLLSTRNLEPGYDVGNTLEAFARLRARYPGATLTVAGHGSQEGALRRQAAALGIDGAVRFVGRVEPAAMPSLCDEADIFVNSSLVDNQPISLLEALAAGLAVVSTAPGGISEMVRDGDTGRLVPERDPAALASAIGGLLEDPDRAVAMARRGRQAISIHTWPRVRDLWAGAYGASA